jgi:hypothetical protein
MISLSLLYNLSTAIIHFWTLISYRQMKVQQNSQSRMPNPISDFTISNFLSGHTIPLTLYSLYNDSTSDQQCPICNSFYADPLQLCSTRRPQWHVGVRMSDPQHGCMQTLHRARLFGESIFVATHHRATRVRCAESSGCQHRIEHARMD